MKNTFRGSTAALIAGGVMLLGAIPRLADDRDSAGDAITCAITTIFGALAYRMIKKRRLGIRLDSASSRITEVIPAVVAVAVVLLQNRLLDRMYENPFVNVLVPACVVFACARAMTAPVDKPTSDSASKGAAAGA